MDSNQVGTYGEDGMQGMAGASQMGLAEMLQMCCQSKRNGQLTYTVGEDVGYLYFHHGTLVHAVSGSLEGEPAVYQMLQKEGGTFDFNEVNLPNLRTIAATWEQLLIQSATIADQGIDLKELQEQLQAAAGSVVQSRIDGGVPQLTVIDGRITEDAFELDGDYIHVGRVEGNDITLPLPAVSSRHCMFQITGTDVLLRDLNSSNGTFVNGEPINETILQLGDVIQIGPVKLKFESRVRRPKLRRPVQEQAPINPEADRGQTLLNPLRSLSVLKRNTSQQAQADAPTVRSSVADSQNAPIAPVEERPAGTVGLDRPIVFDDLEKPKEPKEVSNLLPAVIIISSILIAAVVATYIIFVVLA